jgi:hypothetical protein
MDVKEVNKKDSGNEQVIERFPIENSPFTVISVDEDHFGVMGEYRMTENYKSRGECEDELKCITWNRIIQVMMVLEQIRNKDKDFNNEIENKLKTNK